MLKSIVLVALVVAKTAHADRCDDGVKALAKHDLPRAALYLDGCDDAQPAAVRELRKKLEASDLSVLEVVSKPDKLEGEIDALPGEKFTTPATLYVPAGEHKVRAGNVTNTVTTKPHARAVVILEDAAPKTTGPKDGHADFREDTPDAPDPVGPPPPTQHRPMMPCKFTNSCTEAGDKLDDPLAGGADLPPPHPPAASYELRAGAGEFVGGLGAAFGLSGTFIAPWDDSTTATHPWLLVARADWSKRRSGDSLGATFAVGKVIASPDTAWLSVAVGPHLGVGIEERPMSGGDTTTQSNESGAALLVELALRRLPVSVSARYEQGFVPLYRDSSYEHAVILELGVGLRTYHYAR